MATIEELTAKIDSLEAKLAAVGQRGEGERLPSEPDPKPVGSDGRTVDAGNGNGNREEQFYSWEQLQNAAQEGKITEAAAHQIWAEQNRKLAVREATQAVTTSINAQTTASRVEAEIGRYREAIPQVMDPSSEQRARVVREFSRLTGGLGYAKDDLRTELAALHAAFGPIDSVVRAIKTKSDGHRDVSSDDDDPGPADDGKDKDPETTSPSSLSADERRYYQDAISKGIYKNWGAVREELKFANKRVRQKYGARV